MLYKHLKGHTCESLDYFRGVPYQICNIDNDSPSELGEDNETSNTSNVNDSAITSNEPPNPNYI